MVAGLILLTGLALGLAWLVAISPGRPDPLRDAMGNVIPGSLSERVTVEIGGIPQGMIIQSVDPANPVLLFLHGGPGMTEVFMELDYPTGLERHFTMVWWEQRGAGMSFSPDIPPETMTMEQMIADTIEVADYLRDRFDQDRILLLGHSWGSYLGIQVAAAAPDRFLAYVGMAQIVHQLRSEVMAHAYLLDTYRARGDTAMVGRLEAAPVSMEAGSHRNGCGCAIPRCIGRASAIPATSRRSSRASSCRSGGCGPIRSWTRSTSGAARSGRGRSFGRTCCGTT